MVMIRNLMLRVLRREEGRGGGGGKCGRGCLQDTREEYQLLPEAWRDGEASQNPVGFLNGITEGDLYVP
jgi:hypothetical protein